MEKKRIFIAILLSEEIREKILKIQEEFKNSGFFEGKMVEIENLHLTLKFLGEIDENCLEDVKKRLGEIKFEEINAKIDYSGVFDEKFLRIIWLHLTGVENLQKNIDLELVDLFNMEKRFMSHLTIFRIKKIKEKEKLLEKIKKTKIEPINFKINSFYLMESKLSGTGPTYKIIKEYKSC